MKKLYLGFVLFFLFSPLLSAQDELQAVEDETSALRSLLGSPDNSVTSVKLISDAEQNLTVNVNYKGFSGKKFQIKGSILNRSKKPLKEVDAIEKELPTHGSSIDLTFTFKARSGYKSSYINSNYLLLTISEAGNALSGLDKLLGTVSLSGEDYLYHLNKKWRVGGSESMLITVKLIPYKTAKYIKP